MYKASETHNLLAEGAPGGDTKHGRPHVLLRDCAVDGVVANLAYASTKGDEARRDPRPAFVCVDRGAAAYAGTGLREKTWVYLSRLITTDPADLTRPRGELREEWPDIRRQLFASFGIGTGTTRDGAAVGSLRGCVVRLTPAIRDELDGAGYALVVTEPAYSRRRRYQHLVPIYLGVEAFGEEDDLEVQGNWVKGLSPGSASAFLAIPAVFSGCETGRPRTPGHFAQLTAIVVDRTTIEQVESALVSWFGLDDLA
jgi:hypothetical protein